MLIFWFEAWQIVRLEMSSVTIGGYNAEFAILDERPWVTLLNRKGRYEAIALITALRCD